MSPELRTTLATASPEQRILVRVGIFLGGASSRMGSPKALLPVSDGETLFTRTVRVITEAGLFPCLVGMRPEVLVGLGEHGLVVLEDAATDKGPLAGLVALLRRADGARVVALACDMPYVDVATLERLVGSSSEHAIVAPRRGAFWEPLCGIYDSRRVLPVAERRLAEGALGLQGLLSECGAEELVVDDRVLHDWDCPADRDTAR